MNNYTKRPVGLTILAIALWWLSLGALGAVFALSGGNPILVLAFLAYAGAGFASGYAIWSRKHWASIAFLVWAGAVLLNGVIFDLLFNGGPTMRIIIFLALIAACLLWLKRYVRVNTNAGI